MNIVDEVYKTLKSNRLCKSTQEFSAEFFNKSDSYYSVIKAQRREPNDTVLFSLANNLDKHKDENLVYKDCLKKVVAELALRFTNHQKLSQSVTDQLIDSLKELNGSR